MVKKDTKAITLMDLLKKCEEEELLYVVLRNHEQLPEEIGNDVDILIEEGKEDAFQDVVEEMVEKHGWYVHQRDSGNYYILYQYKNEEWISVRIDAITNLQVQGREYPGASAVLSQRKKNKKGIYIPSPTHEIVHIIIHTLFGPHYNREKYTKALEEKLEKEEFDRGTAKIMLEKVFKSYTAEEITVALGEKNIQKIFRGENTLWQIFTKKHKEEVKSETLFSKIKRRIFPTGKFVVIVGPDGVGKSTTAEHVQELFKIFHQPATHMHLGFRPCVLPTKKAIKEAVKSGGTSGEPGESTTPGLLRFLYYTLDYFLGYFVNIRPLLVRGQIVLGERYYYNYLIDPRPKRQLMFPSWLPRLLWAFMPKPHTLVLLSHDASVVYERRQEHTEEEIDRQIKKFRKEGKRRKRFIELRTDTDPHKVATALAQKLTAFRLAIFASHPIQYQSPLWREIAKKPRIDPYVYYCHDFGVKEKMSIEHGVKYKWDMPLLEGYDHEFLKNYARNPQPSFSGLINPGIIKALWKHKYDGVMIFGHVGISVWLGFAGAIVSRTPIFLRTVASRYYDEHVPQPRTKLIAKRIFLKTLYSFVAGFLSIGTRNTDFYKNLGISDKKIYNFPYGVDNEFYKRESAKWHNKKDEAREELGMKPGTVIILFASRMNRIKHPDYALEAYKKMGYKKNAALVFVGDGDLREGLEKKVKREMIENVHFLGFKNQTEMAKFYTISDIFIRTGGPYKGDWGATVNEAMVCGLPIIAADALGAGDDLIYPGENGYIYPLGDTNALARILDKLGQDKEKMKEMGERSKEIIEHWGYKEDTRGLFKALTHCARGRKRV
jgi:glycosyltransferase involved in cell wall biosynthesis